MGILQGSGDLVNVGNDALYRQRSARWMHLSQRTIGGIVHDKKGQVLLHVKIEDAHDMGMHETSNRARLRAEWFDVVARQVGMQHFDGHLRVEVQVLSQVDVGKTALSQQAQQVIVAQVLSHASGHPRTSSRELHFIRICEPIYNLALASIALPASDISCVRMRIYIRFINELTHLKLVINPEKPLHSITCALCCLVILTCGSMAQ